MKGAAIKALIGAGVALFVLLLFYSAGMLIDYFQGPHTEPVEFITPTESLGSVKQ